MKNYIGTIIKKIRTNQSITQKQLSKDICTDRQLSRIENNESCPSAYILQELSYRLNNNLSEYIKYSDCPSGYEVKNEIDHLMSLFNQLKHTKIKKYLSESYYLNNTISTYAILEIKWLMGAISNYIDTTIEVNSDYFYHLLNTDTRLEEKLKLRLKPIEYRILNSHIVHLIYEGSYSYAENMLLSGILSFEKYHHKITDSSYVRFIYNLSKLYFDQHKYNKSIVLCKKGVNHCLQNNDISYLADLYIIWGQCEIETNNKIDGIKYLRNYIHLRNLFDPGIDYHKTIELLTSKYNLSLANIEFQKI